MTNDLPAVPVINTIKYFTFESLNSLDDLRKIFFLNLFLDSDLIHFRIKGFDLIIEQIHKFALISDCLGINLPTFSHP